MRAAPGPSDWRAQMRLRLRSLDALAARFPEHVLPAGAAEAARRFPPAVTPYYASLVAEAGPDPIWNMIVPDGREAIMPPFTSDDPYAEDRHMPVPGLIRRYDDRAVILLTRACASYCRFCMRRRLAGGNERALPMKDIRRIAAWLRAHPEVRDILLSGGDPLLLPNERLDRILALLRAVPSVELVRIGTRAPVVLPMRIDRGLCAALRRHPPIYLHTHFNHPRELTPLAARACRRLAEAGVVLGNQTVLLRDVNDDADTLEALFRGLLRMRVRPYYLFQCDLVAGVEHFRTRIRDGQAILRELMRRMGGLGIPRFALDAVGAEGKIPLMPDAVLSDDRDGTRLQTLDGRPLCYPHSAIAPETSRPPRVRGPHDKPFSDPP